MKRVQSISAAIFIVVAMSGCGSSDEEKVESITWYPPAGNATISSDTSTPFLEILDNISADEIGTVSQGRELFLAKWEVAPNSRETLDGLGPLYNADSCFDCHISDGRVAPYKEDGTVDNSFLFRTSDASGNAHPIYGGQLQTHSTVEFEEEAQISWEDENGTIEFSSSPDLSQEGFDISGRIAPQLLGMGLLDLVEEETILEYEDPDDSDNDGISGRAHWVIEENQTKVGRFGWKAINSTLRTQNAGAMFQDMGLTSSVNMQENCTENQDVCEEEENGGSPEVSEASLGAIVNFMTALGVPDRRVDNQENFDKGATLFSSIGCAKCHRETMRTGTSDKFARLSNQLIYPYTDLLLHDMGDDLADEVIEKNATGREFRTSPLWGIGFVAQKDGARFLHDGRAQTIKEAILYHGGEAQNAKEKFEQLSSSEMQNLLEFVQGI
ncbi:di-heme oxidoredictase family protein [Sulfurimonas sp.]|uniref:di-heme oxidoredictase family protein n=1 Tax=Sulfurimonas sp. TaxID=2022749 RepID=UPI003D12A047